MPIMRQDLDETDRRIVAALLASPRATWREVGRCLDLSERTVVRRAVRSTPTAPPGRPQGPAAAARLAATDAVRSWTAHTMLRVFPAAFRWTGGLLSAEEIARLTPVAATVGPTNLLVALAVTDQDAVYGFLVDTIGPLRGITAIETTLLLATAKHTGLARRSSRLLD
jgi:hypothetical protein